MNKNQKELAKKLVAHKNWKWIDQGIKYDHPTLGWMRPIMLRPKDDMSGYYPDLNDPATAGVLLNLIGDKLHEIYKHTPENVKLGRAGITWVIEWICWDKPNGLGAAIVQADGGNTLGEACANTLLALWAENDADLEL